jgi:hypothetical protein
VAALGSAAVSAVLRDFAADVTRTALRDGDARQQVAGLVGAGAGLTPSGDDALCGVLLALRAVGGPAAAPALRAVQRHIGASTRATTSLSASLLLAACEGYAVPEVSRLVAAVATGEVPAVERALPAVLAIGHSSGADLLAGVGGALDALLADAPDTTPEPTTTHHFEPEGARRV